MISTRDMSVVAAICKYPDLSEEEKDALLNNVEDQRYIPICSVILGRQERSSLSEIELQVLAEIESWSNYRTMRINAEQRAARYRGEPTQMAKNLIRMRDRGQISEKTLIMYGISGDLPDRAIYHALSQEEKRNLWENRLASRFGTSWRSCFTTVPSIFNYEEQVSEQWLTEGF